MQLMKLYNLPETKDRRQSSVPVANDRRSGIDRRTADRVVIDPKIRQDLYAARKLMHSQAPDVFVKSDKGLSTSTQNHVAKTIPVVGPAFNGLKQFFNIKDKPDNKDRALEASISAVGAGVGLALPLLGGVVNPLALCACTAVGFVSSFVLGAKAIEFANLRDQNKR